MNELLNNALEMNPSGIEGGYRVLVEAMCKGVAALAADGTVLYCNERLSDLLGVPLHRIVSSPVTRHLSKRTTNAVETILDRARSGERIAARLKLRSVNGRCVPVQLSIREMSSFENATCCMVITDLTERKAEDELVAAGRLSRLILESVFADLRQRQQGLLSTQLTVKPRPAFFPARGALWIPEKSDHSRSLS